MDNLIGIILVFVFAIIFIVVIIRWVFSIPTIINNLKAQTALLTKIARKHGVSEDDIEGILNGNDVNE